MPENKFCKHQIEKIFEKLNKRYIACKADSYSECPYNSLEQAKQHNCSDFKENPNFKPKCGCMENDYFDGLFVHTLPSKSKYFH